MKHPVLTALWIGIGFTLYFCFGIGHYDLFDWDEINFAECAREMLNSNNFLKVQLYYKPFWEKPPLYIWMQAMSMKLFGVSAFAARFPNALCGGISMGLIYLWGIRYNRLVWASLWMLMLSCCLLPVMYFKSGIIDPWFNLFIFLNLVFFSFLRHSESFRENDTELVMGVEPMTSSLPMKCNYHCATSA